jgi:fumarate reductase flavoprotein subunit
VSIANAIARLPSPDSTVVICDETGWNVAGRERFLPANPNLLKAGGTLISAASLRELASKAGVEPDGLVREVEAYNAAVAGETTARLEPPRTTSKFRAFPIRSAPFYALPAAAGITYTMGGIAIDDACRVKTPAGEPIPGLYAAGSTTGGIEGGEHAGYVGGLVKASVTGLRCAEHIAGIPA